MRDCILLLGLCLIVGCARVISPDERAEAYRAQMDQLASSCLQSLKQEKATPENTNAVVSCMNIQYQEDQARLAAIRQHRALIRSAISRASRSRLPARKTSVCSSGPLKRAGC